MIKLAVLVTAVALIATGCESAPNTETRVINKGGTAQFTYSVSCA